LRNVLNVITVVGGCVFAAGPLRITRLKALRTQLGGGGQGVDLHARVVVIKLAVNRPTLRGKQIANGVAQSSLAAMANVQWTRGVGRHKFHQYFFMALGLFAKARCRMQHFFDHRLFGAGLELEVQKAWACNVDAFNPLAECRCGHERSAQSLAHLPWVLSQGFGQVHGGRAGQIAMGGHLG